MKFTKKSDLVEKIRVYTTRIDTVFSMAFVVIAPDHSKVIDFITEEQKESCLDYINKSKNESEQERTNE
jgi:leucyl-tRNA synthetase